MDIKNYSEMTGASLLSKDVYCVCFPMRDGTDMLLGELAAARKKFFTGGKKAVRVGKEDAAKGFDGKLKGKLSRKKLYWKKTGVSTVLEEAFDLRNGSVVVRRDQRGIVVSRTYFDKEQAWIKSEYFEPWDSVHPRVTFKPNESFNLIERFDVSGQRTRSTELHPLPYLSGSAEQSLLNARFGEPTLIVSTSEGEICYCTKKDAQKRISAMENIKDGSIVMMPAWEVKDGVIGADDKDDEPEEDYVSFRDIDETAEINENAPSPVIGAEPEADMTEGSAKEKPAEPEIKEEPAKPEKPAFSEEDDFILAAARRAAGIIPRDEKHAKEAEKHEAEFEQPKDEPVEDISPEEPEEIEQNETNVSELIEMIESGSPTDEEKEAPEAEPEKETEETETALVMPVLTGRNRTEQENGLTAYDGEYVDGKREGFGAYYDKNGNLSYAGLWKDDKKDGVGVSFRGSDHAMHIAKWENGKPGDNVSLFDRDGNLRYSGQMVNGKKEGLGVSLNNEDGTVFFGQWENGQTAGMGAAFDGEGRLIYYGGWRDGKRNGHGTEFDGKGGVVYDGDWKDDKYFNGILYQKQNEE